MNIKIFCRCSLFPSWSGQGLISTPVYMYRGADKSLARLTSRCILFDGENISFDASLVIYINSTNIPPIMIINRIYETQNLLSLQPVSFLVGLRTYQHPCTCTPFITAADENHTHALQTVGYLLIFPSRPVRKLLRMSN